MRLNPLNYYSPVMNRRYMSVSQFKSFRECPACAMAELNGKYTREKTIPMLVGSYIDAYFEGTLPLFKNQNPEIFNQKTGELKREFLQAEEIIQRIKRDRLFMQYLMGRKQVIMTGTICGVAVKIKIDSLLPDKIVDLKIMRDFEPQFVKDRGRLRWWEAWGYDLQGAVYQEIVRQNTGKVLPFYLAGATKEKVTNLDILHLGQGELDMAMEGFRRDVQLYDAMKLGIVEAPRCGRCDYCKQTKILTVPAESEEYDLFW